MTSDALGPLGGPFGRPFGGRNHPQAAPRTGRLLRLRWRLVILATIAVLPLAVVFGFALRALLQQQAVETERAALDLTRALATAIDSELGLTVSALQALALTEAMAASEPAGLESAHRLAIDALAARPEWRAVLLTGPTGQVLFRTGFPFGAAPSGVNEPDSLAQLVRNPVPTVGSLAIGRSGNSGIPIRVPALIDESTHQSASDQLARNSVLSFRNNTRNDYLLRCLLTCRTCGLAMFGITSLNHVPACPCRANLCGVPRHLGWPLMNANRSPFKNESGHGCPFISTSFGL